MMAVRVTGRDGVLVARTVHPEYREVMHTYAQHQGHDAREVGYIAEGGAGAGRVDKAGGVPDIPETKNYVLSILSHFLQ